jgi:hypothetical protein
MSSIFVQIASYHDYELSKTILSAIENSSGNNHIHFGVHNCFLESNHIHIPNVDMVEHVKISLIESKAPDNIGVGASRFLANSLYDNEDYYLQVDSHSRFVKNWDIDLINCLQEYQKCGVDKPLLTTYPAVYEYDNCLMENFIDAEVSNISFHERPDFSDTLIPHQTSVGKENNLSYSVSAGFIFTIGEFHKIAVNSKIAFWGEEILIAVRAFTHGYSLLVPDKQYLFHLYYAPNKPFQQNQRRHIWADWPDEHSKMDAISKEEIKRIFSQAVIGDNELGTVRTLEEFEQFAGLNFKNGKVV